ncbi:MAG: electron transport complex subunit RsxE [Bacilli bacterium]|nr:electron transport complex subunit RsxE [Bacilli bacterium]
MEKSKKLPIFLDPLLKANPLFVMVLGTCPALAVTTSFEAAIGMGMLFTFVVLFSNIIISALRKVIPDEIRTPCFIVVIATFVTIVKILSSTFLPELYSTLGVFVSLLVVNCIVLGRAEAFASQNTVVDSILDGLGNGVGYTWAIGAIALVREVLGTGTLTFGKTFTFIPETTLPILAKFPGSTFSAAMPVFRSNAGGFLVLGIALAIIAAIENEKKRKEKEKEKAKVAAAKAAAAKAAAAKAMAASEAAAEGGK